MLDVFFDFMQIIWSIILSQLIMKRAAPYDIDERTFEDAPRQEANPSNSGRAIDPNGPHMTGRK